MATQLDNTPFSLYLHIPFCIKRCGYCDFNTYAGKQVWIPDYVDALCLEIEKVVDSYLETINIHTIYLGGGTPSLVPLEDLEKIFDSIAKLFHYQEKMEISMEVNPGSVSKMYLDGLVALGITRLSLGMQSAKDAELAVLDRIHTFRDVVQSVEWARGAGFEQLNLDLIYGIPGQTLGDWKENLTEALALQPEHLSLYALTLEHNVPMYTMIKEGRLTSIDDDLMADMYEMTMDYLGEAGFKQYEISNWARNSAQGDLLTCLHNLQYWRNLPYLGFGAGAHGCAQGMRTENIRRIEPYINRCVKSDAGEFPQGPALKSVSKIGIRQEMQETVFLGLRLTEEGVSGSQFQARFGVRLEEIFADELQKLEQIGLIEHVGGTVDRFRLTRKGRFLSNQVFIQFID